MFQSMKIKGKRLAAFGVLLLLCGALAGCGYFAIVRVAEIGEVETAFNKISTTALQMRTLQNDFLTRDIKNEKFMESGKSKYVSDMRELAAVQDSIISSLLENKWSAKLDIHKDLTSLKTNFEAYHNTFSKLTEAYKKRGLKDFGDEGELRVAVREVGQQISIR